MTEKKIIEVDYCKEAMEMHLSTLSTKDIDLIVYNIAKVITGELNDVNIEWTRIDEKTNEPHKVKVPVKSFLRCDSIKESLKSLGITEDQISNHGNVSVTPKKSKPLNLEEVKKVIYNTLKEKYGDAVISKRYQKEIVIDTETEVAGNSDVYISLEYFH